MSSLVRPNIVEYLPLVEGYSVVEVKAPEAFAGRSLKDLNLRSEYRIEVIGIKSSGGRQDQLNIIPSADQEIPTGSSLLVIGLDEDIERLQKA